jgi:hypothetical protein
MMQFNVKVPDKPGSLERVCEVISTAGVNIKAISNEQHSGGKAVVRVVTNDESSTKSALDRNHMFFTASEILDVKLDDRPGELLKIARMMKEAENNINSIYILGRENGKTVVALAPENVREARKLLYNYL